jgi:hypothetical protein
MIGMSGLIIECPGCGLKLPNQKITIQHNYNASGECYQKYSELSFYTIGKQDINFIHQHAIDAYSAQHAGNGMKNITIAYSLIGLYYAIEHGFSGKQVQCVHMLLSKQKNSWEQLDLPKKPYSITVNDILNEKQGENRDNMINNWMCDVWNCWEHQHNWVKEITKTLLDRRNHD